MLLFVPRTFFPCDFFIHLRLRYSADFSIPFPYVSRYGILAFSNTLFDCECNSNFNSYFQLAPVFHFALFHFAIYCDAQVSTLCCRFSFSFYSSLGIGISILGISIRIDVFLSLPLVSTLPAFGGRTSLAFQMDSSLSRGTYATSLYLYIYLEDI